MLGFLKFCPDLHKTPALKITCPPHEKKIIQRIVSEEGRINNSDKMIELHELRQYVFRNRVDEMHWDLSSTFEISSARTNRVSSQILPTVVEEDHDDHNDELQIIQGEDNTDGISIEIQPNENPAVSDPPIEEESTVSLPVHQEGTGKKESLSKEAPLSKYQYEVGTFVAIQPDSNEGNNSRKEKFWIGKVTSFQKESNESFVRQLKVH